MSDADADQVVWVEGHHRVPHDGADRAKPRPRDRRWLLVVGALVAAWVAVVGLGRLTQPDDVALPAPEPTSTPTPTVVVTPTPVLLPTPVPLEVPAEEVDGAQLGARFESTVQIERLVRQLERRETSATLVYRSLEGLVVIDLAAGTTRLIAPRTPIGGDGVDPLDVGDDAVLFRANGETVAIDPIELTARRITDDGSLIIVDTQDGGSFWVPGRDLQGQAAQVIFSEPGEPVGAYRAPHATQLGVYDGYGLVAVGKGPSGGTWLAGPDGFERVSNARVVDASASGRIEDGCDERGCQLEVVLRSGGGWDVAGGFIELGDRLVLSPDAQAVLRYTPQGFAEIYSSQNQNVSWVTGASMRGPAWGPDSSFVVWLDMLGSPELRVMFVDERDWLTIDLAEVGAPRPIGPEIVVFESPGEPTAG